MMLEEMASKPEITRLAKPDTLNYEAYPLTMAALRAFRASRHFRREILDKMKLGSDTMLDLGNLYTAALPAWMAAGFEQALDENSLEAGQEVLTLGYGSGGRGKSPCGTRHLEPGETVRGNPGTSEGRSRP